MLYGFGWSMIDPVAQLLLWCTNSEIACSIPIHIIFILQTVPRIRFKLLEHSRFESSWQVRKLRNKATPVIFGG